MNAKFELILNYYFGGLGNFAGSSKDSNSNASIIPFTSHEKNL